MTRLNAMAATTPTPVIHTAWRSTMPRTSLGRALVERQIPAVVVVAHLFDLLDHADDGAPGRIGTVAEPDPYTDGVGLAYIDIHLLASALLSNVPLWTRDKHLHAAAEALGVSFD